MTMKSNQTVKVNATKLVETKKNVSSNVTANKTSNITANKSSNITVNKTVNVTANITMAIQKNVTTNVTANITSNTTVNVTSNVTGNKTEILPLLPKDLRNRWLHLNKSHQITSNRVPHLPRARKISTWTNRARKIRTTKRTRSQFQASTSL